MSSIIPRIIKGLSHSGAVTIAGVAPIYFVLETTTAKLEYPLAAILAAGFFSVIVFSTFLMGFGWDRTITTVEKDKLLYSKFKRIEPAFNVFAWAVVFLSILFVAAAALLRK